MRSSVCCPCRNDIIILIHYMHHFLNIHYRWDFRFPNYRIWTEIRLWFGTPLTTLSTVICIQKCLHIFVWLFCKAKGVMAFVHACRVPFSTWPCLFVKHILTPSYLKKIIKTLSATLVWLNTCCSAFFLSCFGWSLFAPWPCIYLAYKIIWIFYQLAVYYNIFQWSDDEFAVTRF